MSTTSPGPAELAGAVRAGDRRALAQAITLVESSRPDHRLEAEALLGELLADTGGAVRIGISGAPGVGKSTFVEAFGLELLDHAHQLAVLAVDPSSARSGGSILGDKTRMAELSRHPDAFIRPSPAGDGLGGVARRTREAMLLCEAAGFDVVVVETVGVGQSEYAVSEMVDMFLVLVAPGGGDDLQGIKRGIMELVDLVVVNKADGALAEAAHGVAADYRHALHLLRPARVSWTPRVVVCSSLERRGIDEVWASVRELEAVLRESGELDHQRAEQAVTWMWTEIRAQLLDELRRDPAVSARLENLEAEVRAGEVLAPEAARRAVRATRSHSETT